MKHREGKELDDSHYELTREVESILLEEKIQKVIGYSHIDRVTAQKMRMAAKKL